MTTTPSQPPHESDAAIAESIARAIAESTTDPMLIGGTERVTKDDVLWLCGRVGSAAQAQEQLREANKNHKAEIESYVQHCADEYNRGYEHGEEAGRDYVDDQLRAANERVGVLEAALKPFADMLDLNDEPGEKPLYTDRCPLGLAPGIRNDGTLPCVGDLRRARTALSTPAEKD